MKKKRSVDINTKIIIGFSGILVLMVGLALFGITRVLQINRDLTRINDVNAVKQRYAINFRGSVHDRSIDIRDVILIENDRALLESVYENIDRLKVFYEDSEDPLDRIFAEDQTILEVERNALTNIKQIESRTEPVVEEIIRLRESGDIETARELLLESARPLFTSWLDAINVFIDYQEEQNNFIATRTREIADGYARIILIATGAALLAGALLALWSIRSIIPLRNINSAIRDISEGDGDLTKQLDVRSDDEVGRLSDEFNQFIANLRGIISQVKEGSESLDSVSSELKNQMRETSEAVSEISRVMDQLENEVTNTQAGQVSEVSATVEEIAQNTAALSQAIEKQANTIADSTAAVQQMIANIASITDLLSKSSERFDYLKVVADKGAEIIQQVNRMVDGISSQSDGVLETNKLISNISAQTNLLAMNAAIEAAHAGEAGRGFAVVAAEIRNLAENSAQQSRSISEVLKTLQTSIHDVVDKSDEAGEAFASVQGAIGTVVDLQKQVEVAMQEQSAGNKQVLDSFQVITELTGQVQNGSRVMTEGSAKIQTTMGKLVEGSRQVESRIDTINGKTRNIEQTVKNVDQLSENAFERAKQVSSSVGRFIL